MHWAGNNHIRKRSAAVYVVIVWLNDLRLAGVKRCMEMNKGVFFP